jgi:hypothetical protein
MIVVVSNIPGHALQPNLPPRTVITLQNCVPERSYGGVAARGKRAATGATGGRVPRQQAV